MCTKSTLLCIEMTCITNRQYSNKLREFAVSFIYAYGYSSRLPRSLLDTNQISQSSIPIPKSPRCEGNEIIHTYMYCGQFWVILGEDDKKYLNPLKQSAHSDWPIQHLLFAHGCMLLTYSITKTKRMLCDVAQFDHCDDVYRCRQEYRPCKTTFDLFFPQYQR